MKFHPQVILVDQSGHTSTGQITSEMSPTKEHGMVKIELSVYCFAFSYDYSLPAVDGKQFTACGGSV